MTFSRIIEIAGGRELFSASRTKALRSKVAKPDPERKPPARASRELTETVFSTEVHSVKLQRDIGGAIVFDDIEEPPTPTWRRDRRDRHESAGSSPSPPSYHQTPSDFFKVSHYVIYRSETGAGRGGEKDENFM